MSNPYQSCILMPTLLNVLFGITFLYISAFLSDSFYAMPSQVSRHDEIVWMRMSRDEPPQLKNIEVRSGHENSLVGGRPGKSGSRVWVRELFTSLSLHQPRTIVVRL